ncbi:tetratricopeptide repeat protein [Panacagrimonas sp.]|uniref:tetratricopeptide repeat protein n=1 Tax=Panacagrimonas sp. TaxID=2480088 RepID=UPI003B515675
MNARPHPIGAFALMSLGLGLGLGLGGCTTSPDRQQLDRMVAEEIPDDSPDARRKVHTDLIRGMLRQQQYYAAVAHIEAQVRESGPSDELRLLEADARRRLGQSAAAQAIYRELLRTEFAAQAYHGLGLTNVQTDLRTAVWQMQQAVQRRPTDTEMRNDLGYALMLAGQHGAALTQLATAVELETGSGSKKARHNLILLMIVTGDEPAVKKLAQEADLTDTALAGMRRQAQSFPQRPIVALPISPKG